MSPQDISEQVADFQRTFNAEIGPDLEAIFEAEQAHLRSLGIPADAVRVGDQIVDASLLTPTGRDIALIDAIGEAPAVVVFYRGAWCPYCNITLKTYQDDLLPALRARGVELVAISPQSPAGSEESVAAGDLEFTVLSDPGNVLSRALGIATEPSFEARGAHRELGFDMADSNVGGSAEIPFPTVLVIDGDGRVVFVDIHTDYTSRTEVSLVLETLDLLELGVL
jgi:peroxiredoxin